MSIKKANLGLTRTISVIAILLLIIIYCLQWYHIENSLKIFQKEQKKEFKSLEEIKKNALIQIQQVKIKDSTVNVKIEEIQIINERFDLLFEFVNNNTDRAESLIDKDIDRLNMFLAIGIGFIGILGVFVPILVNLMSVQDIRDKMKEYDGIGEKINSLSIKYNKAVPLISTLILQNAISRFFNVSPYILTKLSRPKNRDYFIELLYTIKLGFENCSIDKNHSFDDPFLKVTIKDFRYFIVENSFQSTFFGSPTMDKFFELHTLLKVLSETNITDEIKANLDVRNKIDEIISDLKFKTK